MSTHEPLTPADCDLRDFAFMPVDVRRLLTSETWLTASGDEKAAAMTLWLESWHQVPAASLPDSDRMLAILSQAGARWRKLRPIALRGWVKCSDGRLYHPVVAEKAVEAWSQKRKHRDKRNKDAARLKRWREQRGNDDRTQDETRSETTTETRDVAEREREREGEGQGHRAAASSPPSASPGDHAAAALRIYAEIGGNCGATILNTGRIDTWRRDGCDIDLDILPAIRERCRRKREREPGWMPRGLDYFDGAIADAKARRLVPMPHGQPNGASPAMQRALDRPPIIDKAKAEAAEYASRGEEVPRAPKPPRPIRKEPQR